VKSFMHADVSSATVVKGSENATTRAVASPLGISRRTYSAATEQVSSQHLPRVLTTDILVCTYLARLQTLLGPTVALND